ncbi:MAG: hypothetical protein DRN91_06680, partial [Candidatus Alkanophagales archaeon]
NKNDAKFNPRANAMIHNFWSPRYLYKRISEKAEEYGIRTRGADERGGTSSECPRCGGSKHVTKRGRLLNA